MKQSIRRIFLFILLIILSGNFISAQSKFSITEGWGYYELTNIGARWNFSEISALWLYGGTNFGFNGKTSWSAGLTFDQTFRKSLFWKLKPGYSMGALYWTTDDDLYYFRTMSFPFMVLLAYPVSESFSIRADGGILFNAVLQSDRKQNVESGYPARVNGNFRLSLIYRFGSK